MVSRCLSTYDFTIDFRGERTRCEGDVADAELDAIFLGIRGEDGIDVRTDVFEVGFVKLLYHNIVFPCVCYLI